MFQKKAQITQFIILGIVILFIVSLSYYIYHLKVEQMMESQINFGEAKQETKTDWNKYAKNKQLYDEALSKLNTSICNYISYVGWKDKCLEIIQSKYLYNKAVNNSNMSICYEINDKNYRGACLLAFK